MCIRAEIYSKTARPPLHKYCNRIEYCNGRLDRHCDGKKVFKFIKKKVRLNTVIDDMHLYCNRVSEIR